MAFAPCALLSSPISPLIGTSSRFGAFPVDIELVALDVLYDWVRHKVSDTHIFPQESPDFRAAHIVAYLLKVVNTLALIRFTADLLGV